MTMRDFIDADDGRPPEPAARPEAAGVPAENVLGEQTGEFSPRRVRLDHELSPDVAMLCVKANTLYGPRSFELHFHYRGRIQSATGSGDLDKQQAHEKLSLSRLKNCDDAAWKDLFDWLEGWCGSQFAINRWLGELLKNERAQLIVFDVTSYEIPWELFYYSTPPDRDLGPEGWLGALIPVTRWTSLPYDTVEWHFGAALQQADGGLLMMEDDGMRAGIDTYDRYEVATRESAFESLAWRLMIEDADGLTFSLLMIRCHGKHTKDNRLLLNGVDLDVIKGKWPVLLRNRAIVLLNACITGRPITDSPDHLGAPTRSFAQKFLGKGAGGVIATMGDIDLDHSHEFAVNFVARAGEQDQNLACYLRDYRADIARRMKPTPGRPDGRTPDDYKMFIWSFMYVYYGHPDTTLRLRPAATS